MGRSLGAVDEEYGVLRVSGAGDLVNGIDRAGDVGDVGEGDDFSAGRDGGVPFEDALRIHGDVAELGACLLGEHLPGNDVGMVLHWGNEDFIVGFKVSFSVGGGDEVDGVGGAASEDDFICVKRVEEFLGGFARGIVFFGGEKR